MKIQWQTEKLEDVIRHFVTGFTPKDGEKIIRAEWFVDPVKGVVIFELMVDESPDNRPG